MCPVGASRGVRWCRSLPTGCDRADRDGARNIPFRGARRPAASPWKPACLQTAKEWSPQVPQLRTVLLWYRAWLHLPDVASVLSDRAVARKFPRTRHVQDCFAGPRTRIEVQSADPVLGLAVGGEVRQVHVVVTVCQERVAQGSRDSWLVAAKVVGENEVQSCPRFRIIFIVPVRVVPAAAVLDLFYIEAEQEEVLLTSLLGHLDGRAVTRSDRQGSVHHELHIARSTCFIAGGGNLVGNVAGRNQSFSQRNVVIRQENNLDLSAHRRIGVNCLC